MLELFTRHGGFDLNLEAHGDLDVDQHHTVEDVGIVLGQLLREALGSKKGINRAGYFLMPMDETLAVAAIDLSGRPYLVLKAPLKVRYRGRSANRVAGRFLSRLHHDRRGQRAPEGGVWAVQPPRHRSPVQSVCAGAALCLLARPPLAIAASQHKGASMIARPRLRRGKCGLGAQGD